MARTEDTPKTKMCTRCGKRKKIDQFYRDKSTKDGRASWCKDDERAYNREYRARVKAGGR
jgi:hypothetical protein